MPSPAETFNVELAAYLAGLLSRPVPPPPAQRGESPVRRSWPPDSYAWPKPYRLVSRHPNFENCSAEVRVVAPPKLSRSARLGWRGVFQSVKTGRPISFRSGVELNALRLAEADPRVSFYVEKPCVIFVEGCGKVQLDLYQEREVERWFTICRTEESAERPKNETNYALLGPTLAAAGLGLEVFTERHAAVQPLAANIAKLLRGRFAACSPTERCLVEQIVGEKGIEFGVLLQSSNLTKDQIYRLVIERVLFVDIEGAAIGDETIVRRQNSTGAA